MRQRTRGAKPAAGQFFHPARDLLPIVTGIESRFGGSGMRPGAQPGAAGAVARHRRLPGRLSPIALLLAAYVTGVQVPSGLRQAAPRAVCGRPSI